MNGFNNNYSQRLKLLYEQIWHLSNSVSDPRSYNALKFATCQLIECYRQQERLQEHPFDPARLRKLSVPVEALDTLLQDSTCLITGGLGCVGTALIKELLQFKVKQIIIVDIRSFEDFQWKDPRVIFSQSDILEADKLNEIFRRFEPQFVFHTAAQRDPGLSEKQPELALKTNILGTLNTMQACERVGTVKQVVFSSTGKASRYYTNEVYAASKKICEFIMSSFARKGSARYSMVRFTHILDNSLMDISLRQQAYERDYVAVHSPGKYVTAQNIGEAADLMLNALVHSQDGQSNFLIVRNLEWPVESLEIALYYIEESKRNIPIIFTGCPTGYIEKFFRGQLDWSMPQELNLLISVYENKRRKVNDAGDILISSIDPCSDELLYACIEKIRSSRGDVDSRNELLHSLRVLVGDSLKGVDKDDTTRIIRWGTDSRHLELEDNNLSDFKDILSLLYDSLSENHSAMIADTLAANTLKKAEDVAYQ